MICLCLIKFIQDFWDYSFIALLLPFFLIISLPSHAIESDISTHPHISVAPVSEDSHLIKG